MLIRLVDFLWRTLLPNDTDFCTYCGQEFHNSLLIEGEESFLGVEKKYVACEPCHLASLELWIQKIREALTDETSPYYAAYQEMKGNV